MRSPISALLALAVFAAPAWALAAPALVDGVELSGAILSIASCDHPKEIGTPSCAEPGQVLGLKLKLWNGGDQGSQDFDLRITLVPDDLPAGYTPAEIEELYRGRIEGGLAAGAELELDFGTGELGPLQLPRVLRGERYQVVLSIDPAFETGDVNPSNNRVVSTDKIKILKPAMQLRATRLTFPDGECVYGEPVRAEFELCNTGRIAARGFHPGVVIGPREEPSLLKDPVAASFTRTCGEDASGNYFACTSTPGDVNVCAESTCRKICAVDADCRPSPGSGFVIQGSEAPWSCEADPALDEALRTSGSKSCEYRVGAPLGDGLVCQKYDIEGRVPVENQWGERYTAAPMYFHFTDDLYLALSEPRPDLFTTPPYACEPSIPDLTPVYMELDHDLIAGESHPIIRLIRNLRYVEQFPGTPRQEAVTFRYRYFLKDAGAEFNNAAIPLPLVSGAFGTASVGRKADNVFTDRVMVPEHLAAREYDLVLVVDPDQQLREVSKANNLLIAPGVVRVREPTFGILEASLPSAILGSPYAYQFTTRGGLGASTWKAEGLPPGLKLSASGELSGAPTDVGTFAFELEARSGDRVSERLFALRVRAPAGPLEISTSSLPPAVRGRAYGGWIDAGGAARQGIPLAADGGRPPYRWALVSGAKVPPQGIMLEAEGVLRGEPSPLSRTSQFTVRVMDVNGAWAERELEIVVVDGEALTISSRLFSEGLAMRDYESCVEASTGVDSAAVTWTIDESTVPQGLRAEQRGSSGCLIGKPTVCGNFSVKISVADAAGRSLETSLPLSVKCDSIEVKRRFISDLRRGEAVELVLEATSGPASFRLYQGALPPGLELSASGTISGVVAADAGFGPYDFLLALEDGSGRKGFSSMTLRVKSEPRAASGGGGGDSSGCSGAGGGVEGWMLIAMGPVAVLRRRRGPSGSFRRPHGSFDGSRGSFRRLHGWSDGSRGSSRRPHGSFDGSRDGGSGRLPWPAGLLRSLGRRSARGAVVLTLALVGLASCGGSDSDGPAVSRCADVSCEIPGESCDPLDGLCKCGGAEFCTGGMVCSLEPTPHCGSGRCEFVECSGGESCDARTGECSCGGASCGEDERCVDNLCVRRDVCDEIKCGEGTLCDPEDGRCKCRGEICLDGESCIEGTCSFDLCDKSCPTNSFCNPATGVCHCAGISGPICSAGESCVREELIEGAQGSGDDRLVCFESRLCDAVHCEGGTVCDPADGKCHCGGIGVLAPACEAGQTCLDGQCYGGKACEPGGVSKRCDPGFSCDPADGLCKCGGVGGVECQDGETCTKSFGLYTCRRTCPIVIGAGGSCGVGEGCYLDRSMGTAQSFCAQAGTLGISKSCEAFNDCQPGMFCSRANKCRRFCKPSEGNLSCGDVPGTICIAFTPEEAGQPDLGYCAEVG